MLESQRSTPRGGFAQLLSSARIGNVPQSPEQEQRFIQARLALFNQVTFFVSGMFLAVVAIIDAAGELPYTEWMGRAAHAAGTAIALVFWQILRRQRTLSIALLSLFDVLGTLSIAVSFVAMGHLALQPFGFYTSMLGVTHVSIARAVLVPTTPRRTFVLAVASFVGFVVVAGLSTELRGPGLESLLWSVAGIGVSTVASQVTYGLQTQAREAMQLGQYTLEEKIGQGGMGEIYRARHAMLRRPTAIKLLSHGGSEEALQRFEKEVQLTARLTHPHTIAIYDYGRTPDGVFYYAMELLEGMTLEQLVRRHGPLPARRAKAFLLQVCGALGEAHRAGLIHRDIKPANLFVCRRGGIADFIKVLDFGLVREVSDGARAEEVAGTPLFMSPEAIVEPGTVDARTDVYGLGAVAYFLVTGTVPFASANAMEIYARQLNDPPVRPSQHAAVPADLEDVILHCLQKGRELRPQSVDALARELEACVESGTWTAEEAEAWWREVGPSGPAVGLEVQSTLHAPGTVIGVDLGRRR